VRLRVPSRLPETVDQMLTGPAAKRGSRAPFDSSVTPRRCRRPESTLRALTDGALPHSWRDTERCSEQSTAFVEDGWGRPLNLASLAFLRTGTATASDADLSLLSAVRSGSPADHQLCACFGHGVPIGRPPASAAGTR